MKKVIVAVLGLIIVATSCGKDDDQVNDCQVKNYGILKVNFTAANVRHSILVTVSGTTTAKEKIVEVGKISDTLRLYSGSYTASLSSIYDKNEAIESDSKATVIKTCTTTELNASF